jgi:hypothetical protein
MPLILPLFASLLACSTVEGLEARGDDGLPELRWAGDDAETMNVSRDGVAWFTLQPIDPPDSCLNGLDGRDGIVWGDWPEGYETVDYLTPDEVVEVSTPLEDGSYEVNVARCVDAGENFRSLQVDTFVVFDVVDGEVVTIDAE